MSAPGPESIPTSADPRSHRPTKKRALSPTSSHAASLTALFAKPDQNIPIPLASSGPKPRHIPEIYTNVQGSSAGAGSGEFHVYKASRRREYERLKDMDDSLKREKDQSDFEKGRAERLAKDEEKTRKNRERREKMKARKAKKGTSASSEPRTGTEKGMDAPKGGVADSGHAAGAAAPGTKSKDEGSEPVASSSAHAGIVIHDDD